MPTVMIRVTSALSVFRLAGGVNPLGVGGIGVSCGAIRFEGGGFAGAELPDPMVTDEGAAVCGVVSSAPLGCVDSGRSGEGVAAGLAVSGCGAASVALPVSACAYCAQSSAACEGLGP